MSKDKSVSRVGSDERNIARLNPVLALNRVSDDLTGWTKTVTIDSLSSITVTCSTSEKHPVPHGIDGDVMFALTTMYVIQGLPADRYIEFTLAEMCHVLSLSRGKSTYERLQTSLMRLFHVRYSVVESWVNFNRINRKGGSSVRSNQFGIIDNLKAQSEEENWVPPVSGQPWKFQPTTHLQVALNDEIVKSIRAGYVRTVDLEFYGQLDQPFSRLLYRVLEESRHTDPERDRFAFPLVTWGDHLGLREMVQPAEGTGVPETRPLRPDKIRRSLDSAHAELLRLGYLKEATYIGRGLSQTVHYHFGTVQAPADSEAVELLTARGVAIGVAEGHVRRLGVAAVRLAARRFDARKTAGYEARNPGGLISDMLANPDKYIGSESKLPETVAHRELKATRKPVTEAEIAAPSVQDRRKTDMFLLDNWQRSRHITAEQRKKLGVLIETGQLDDQLGQLITLKGRDAVQTFVRSILP